MSIAEKHRFKSKRKLAKEVNNLNFNCPKCGMPVPTEIFNTEDYGMSYCCKVCGCNVFEEFKKQVITR